MKKTSRKQIGVMTKKVIEVYKNKGSDKTDPLGSYTGIPKNPQEKPVQDADDL